MVWLLRPFQSHCTLMPIARGTRCHAGIPLTYRSLSSVDFYLRRATNPMRNARLNARASDKVLRCAARGGEAKPRAIDLGFSLSPNFRVKHSMLETSIWVTPFANRSLETFAQLTYPGRNVCDLCKYVFSTLHVGWNGNVNAFAYLVRTWACVRFAFDSVCYDRNKTLKLDLYKDKGENYTKF